jgi:hypothetical protein
MDKLSFKADLKTKKGEISAQLQLFMFKEDDMFIVFCPAIDLSAYGKSEKEAELEVSEVFRLHMSYCLAKRTLEEDLKAHGWDIKHKQKEILAPKIEELLPKNETLQDIIYNRDYVKMSRPIQIPMF